MCSTGVPARQSKALSSDERERQKEGGLYMDKDEQKEYENEIIFLFFIQ